MTEKANILSFDEARYNESFRPSRQQRPGQGSVQVYRNSYQTSSFRASSRSYNQGQSHRVNQGNHGVNTHSRSAFLGVVSSRKENSSAVSPRRSARASEEYSENASRSVKKKETFIQSLQKKSRSAKADREFTKRFGKQDVSENEQTSRAALYEMRMGRTQKRSSRMQDENASKKKSRGFSFESLFSWISSAFASRLVLAGLGLLFAAGLIYQPLAEYYGETRHLQQLEAEYSALEEQNTALQSEIDYLNTDQGLEDYARYNLGYVRSDEQVATVENVTPSTSSDASGSSNITYAIPEGSISAPDTWYSGVLDVFFGYRK